MGKVVKRIAKALVSPVLAGKKAVLATALVVAGVATGNFALISAGLSVGSSYLKGGKKGSSNSESNIDRLRANVDPRTPRKSVVGITALATDIRDEEFTGDQEYFHRFIVCASHKVQSIDEIWFDDEMAWSSSGGVTSEFSGYLTVATRTEGNSGNTINISSRMGSTRRYTGLAYVHLRYKLTGNDKKTDSPFAQSITTRITIRGKGALLYDPRLDSTVAGGSGSHRADNQATWTWDADACRNPALALLFYLLGYRINGELAVGKGIPANRIDLASFAVAANICDEEVATESGGTEPRYRCDGMWSEGDDPKTVIDMLKACMNADLDDVGGKLRLTVFHNDLASPDADFTDDDILDGFEWDPAASLEDSFNIVRGLYTDASDEALYQMVDYPQVETTSPDGIDRIDPVNFAMVQSADQAQRLAQLRLQREAYGGTFAAEFQATGWKVQKNSVVRLTFAPRGWTNKLFRVAEMEIRSDGVVPMVLREEHADIYGPPSLSPPVAPVVSTPWDPALDPIAKTLNDTVNLDGTIASNLVDTPSIVANAVSDTGFAFTAGGTLLPNTGLINLQSLSVTADGVTPVTVQAALAFYWDSDNARAEWAIYRDSTPLVSFDPITVNNNENPTASGFFSDVPPAGTYTYHIKGQANDHLQIGAKNCGLGQVELKR